MMNRLLTGPQETEITPLSWESVTTVITEQRQNPIEDKCSSSVLFQRRASKEEEGKDREREEVEDGFKDEADDRISAL